GHRGTVFDRQGVRRASKRVKARLTVTARFGGDAAVIPCSTRDISGNGLLLDSGRAPAPGTAVSMSLLDDSGEVVELHGVVTRGLPGPPRVPLPHPPPPRTPPPRPLPPRAP